MERNNAASDAFSTNDGNYNRLNQYPLPMPPLPPNVHLSNQTTTPTTIGKIEFK